SPSGSGGATCSPSAGPLPSGSTRCGSTHASAPSIPTAAPSTRACSRPSSVREASSSPASFPCERARTGLPSRSRRRVSRRRSSRASVSWSRERRWPRPSGAGISNGSSPPSGAAADSALLHPGRHARVDHFFLDGKGGSGMKVLRITLAALLVIAVGGALALRDLASAQAQTIKIGVLYDDTGPFSAPGSLNCWRAAKMIIDLTNERGGVLGK